ncbi:MAG: hypothetical protein E7128_02515 [Rikenellaceae bacterium]|nr:hypothetical protein [Rikenellaceae bacterium]
MTQTHDIDFVITWVDGSDPAWQKEYRQYCTPDGSENTSPIRYRDWGTLRYWFRAVEKYAPWVRRIHFITWGHLPEWLDTSNPRLNVVRHADYIPAQYLPTFASRPIELNMHRIEGLADHFVYFNDDMMLGRPVTPERFFRGGLPCDMARLSLIAHCSISHAVLNMSEMINRRYNLREVLRKHPCKWFSPRYGLRNILKTLNLAVWNTIPALTDTHMPQPFLREVFDQMWDEEREVLERTCSSRSRSNDGVNCWVVRYEQLLSGRFAPISESDTKLDTLGEERIGDICDYITHQRYAMYCLNDSTQIKDFESVQRQLLEALQTTLPEKCSYER